MNEEKILDFSKNPHSIIAPVVKLIPDYIQSGKVLDIGTGSGAHALFLAQRGFDVTALDSDKNKLVTLEKVAEEREIKIKTEHADIRTYKFTEDYDIILSTMTLHFLENSEVADVISMMKSHTNHGGLNVISVHTTKNEKNSRPHLFKEGELRGYYNDWEILHYKELWGIPFRKKTGEKIKKKHRAELIAKRTELKKN